ncbi:MAG: RNase adapter RapZ [Candidatus Meridianibacter frigidus]|nr:MAG: RNase adapter RapZ [Candidatus Eremiobacteraeota bacterium]
MFERIVFVTGLSGAGKSQAMKTFEDLGFYCVDNLPPALAERTLTLLDASAIRRIALALDARTGGPLGEAGSVLDNLSRDGTRPQVLFMDARDDVLVRRYSETRRRHPFAGTGTLVEAIAAERGALATLRERSELVIDTTNLTHTQLKEKLGAAYAPSDEQHLNVVLIAFGFKYGIPLDVDLLFDVRFLTNPNYVNELQALTGANEAVGQFIETDAAYRGFVEKLFDLIDFLLPQYVAEGKSQLTIGFGCTGGRHRSVYVARQLMFHLQRNAHLEMHLDARDVTR